MPKMKIKTHASHVFLAIMLVLFSSTAFAQTKITGTVTDPESKPIRGASVLVKGSKAGTVTDENGNFSLSAAKGASLIISMIGYETLTVAIGDQTSLAGQVKDRCFAFERNSCYRLWYPETIVGYECYFQRKQ